MSSFARFDDGDVEISLSPNDEKDLLKLHSQVLGSVSDFFGSGLKEPWLSQETVDTTMIGGQAVVVKRYDLAYDAVFGTWCAIDSSKKSIGKCVGLDRNSPGFSASIKLDNGKGTVKMTAQVEGLSSGALSWPRTLTLFSRDITPDANDWNVNYSYNGKQYTCDGDQCQHYSETSGGLGTYAVHSGTFDC